MLRSRSRAPRQRRDDSPVAGDAAMRDWPLVRKTILSFGCLENGVSARDIVYCLEQDLGFAIGRERVRRAIRYGLGTNELGAIGGRTNRRYVVGPVLAYSLNTDDA